MNIPKDCVIQFSAGWCMPCKMLSPILKEVCGEFGQEYIKIDVEEEQDMAAEYGVMSIPRTFIIKDNVVVADFVGAIPKSDIVLFFKNNL